VASGGASARGAGATGPPVCGQCLRRCRSRHRGAKGEGGHVREDAHDALQFRTLATLVGRVSAPGNELSTHVIYAETVDGATIFESTKQSDSRTGLGKSGG